MARCADQNCACPLPPNARFCPRCGRKVRLSNAGWLFMAFGLLLLLVIGMVFIRADIQSQSHPHVEAGHGSGHDDDAHAPVLPRPNGNFWRP